MTPAAPGQGVRERALLPQQKSAYKAGGCFFCLLTGEGMVAYRFINSPRAPVWCPGSTRGSLWASLRILVDSWGSLLGVGAGFWFLRGSLRELWGDSCLFGVTHAVLG